MFIDSFTFPSRVDEEDYFWDETRINAFQSIYPFHILWREKRTELEFAPLTILYGSNGSGKSTMLNVIAHKLGLDRYSPANLTDYFEDYSRLCSFEPGKDRPRERRIIVSDDVFDIMFRQRLYNSQVDEGREEMTSEYDSIRGKAGGFRMTSLDDAEMLSKINLVNSRRHTRSEYVRNRIGRSSRTRSNGESAVRFFSESMGEDGLYLLDEPENSLSPNTQLKLIAFLEEQVRFYGCQLIIATHSPFILSMKGAKIYNIDSDQPAPCKWTELENVRAYFELFEKHRKKFLGQKTKRLDI